MDVHAYRFACLSIKDVERARIEAKMRNEQMYLECCSEMNNKTQMIYKIVCEGEEHDL